MLCVLGLLEWDANTKMPAAGTATRAHQIATLTEIARSLLTGDALKGAIEDALAEAALLPPDDDRRRAVEQARDAIETLHRIPPRLTIEIAELRTHAQQSWAEARRTDDFAAFAPMLARTFALQRELAQAIGYSEHPYDALLGRYEPGLTLARIRAVYAQLKVGLKPLVARATSRTPPRQDFLARSFPLERQREVSRELATRIGFDFERGRMDDTAHPFESALTRFDVRLTGRFRETALASSILAVLHEAGHGMYEQGIDPALTRSALTVDLLNMEAIGGASLGMHESQSRLWENRVGRSLRFWELNFAVLRDAFPEQLGDVSPAEFAASLNTVKPGLIRVEADEPTYDFHIMLRTELEADLIAGTIEVKDLPVIWRERMRDDLGVEVPDDRSGVLQDIHWSAGMVGGFPGYTIGNIVASQLFDAAFAEPTISAGLDAGDYRPLRTWLNARVHRHGRGRSVDEILVGATGSSIDASHYLAYLDAKFG